MYIYKYTRLHAQHRQRPEQETGSPTTRIMDDYAAMWEPDLSPLQGQQVLLSARPIQSPISSQHTHNLQVFHEELIFLPKHLFLKCSNWSHGAKYL